METDRKTKDLMYTLKDVYWDFEKGIFTEDDLEHAESFWKQCLLAGYGGLYIQELSELKEKINTFKRLNHV
jgi:hypothetical protein